MADEKDLGEILNSTVDAPQAEPASPPETTADQSAPAEQPEERPGDWTYSAWRDEKQKRQAVQKQLNDLEGEYRAVLAAQHEAIAPPEDVWARVERAEARAGDAMLAASKATFPHGKEAFAELDAAVEQAMKSNHPDMPLLAHRMRESTDPVNVAWDWYQRNHKPASPQSFPSNFSGERNVGGRTQPWSGPASLNDIFDRGKRK